MTPNAQNSIDHAKMFDEKYIKLKNTNVFCSQASMIQSYLIVKSMLTEKMNCVVFTNDILAAKTNFLAKIVDNKWDQQLDAFRSKRSKSVIEWKNKSKIYFVNNSDRLKNVMVNIIYVKNDILDTFVLDDWGLVITTNQLDPSGRIIYNFDA